MMVPLADMFNYNYFFNAMWTYDVTSKAFQIRALRDIEIGEEIYLSYGDKSNSDYLQNYGVIDLNNFNN